MALGLKYCFFGRFVKGYDVGSPMSELVNYNLKPDSVLKEVTDILSVIAQISAKSYSTLFRTISLQKNPDEIRMAIPDLFFMYINKYAIINESFLWR